MKLPYWLVPSLWTIGLALASLWPRGEVVAQAPQPALYRVGSYDMQEGRSSVSGVGIYWFETETAECYLTNRAAWASGNGISCLRKERP